MFCRQKSIILSSVGLLEPQVFTRGDWLLETLEDG